ncbi:MAG: hypothetical protein ACRYGF_14685 [Janthinobacterium lividum]
MTWLLAFALMMGQRPPDPNTLYQDGLAASRAGNWTLAINKLYAKQRIAPDAMTYYLLAVAYSHQKQYADTENAARRALQMSPPLIDQFRNPAARLVGWAQGMQAGGGVSVQFVMRNPMNRVRKDPESTAPRKLPEDAAIKDERKSTVEYQAANDPCAGKRDLALSGCRVAHANDTPRMPATRLP